MAASSSSSSLPLVGRVALVTGAGKPEGIGFAVARTLAEQGARVVVSASTQKRAEDAAAALRKTLAASESKKGAGEVTGFGANLRNAKEITALAEAAGKFGKGVVDILVNNAGTIGGPPAPIETQSVEQIEKTFNQIFSVNVLAPLQLTRATLPFLRKSTAGRIINISSIAGTGAVPAFTLYGASKAAVISATGSIAKELAGSNITVNTVAPGPFQTDMFTSLPDAATEAFVKQVPVGRAGKPYAELGPIIALLAGPGGAYTNGSTVTVDGGMRA